MSAKVPEKPRVVFDSGMPNPPVPPHPPWYLLPPAFEGVEFVKSVESLKQHGVDLSGLSLTGYDFGLDSNGRPTTLLLHFGKKKLFIEAGEGYLTVNGGSFIQQHEVAS